MASEASASVTSLSEICPTALWMTLTLIFSVDNLRNESLRASILPSVSPLTMILSSLNSPSAIRWEMSPRVSRFWVRSPCSRCSCRRLFAISRASCSVSSTWNVSPAVGAPFSPRMITGSAGPAFSMRWLRSLNIALMRPHDVPAMTLSPIFSVPLLTRTVETYPRPLSSDDSMMEPVARRFGLALRSSISASKSTFSSSSSTPTPFFALISWHWYLPPHSSTRRFICAKSSRILSGLAPGLSILFMANTIGTFAACAWAIASFVVGITESSAAMMMIAISVTCVPRARMAVNASCPGVSRNVIRRPSPNFTLYAPMCCVIPPASPAITLVLRMWSSSDVLPWSTCPMTVTIGARGTRSFSSSSSSLTASCTSALTYSVLNPNSSATRLIVSASSLWLIDTMIPTLISVLMTCVTLMFIIVASSLTVTNSVSFSILLSLRSARASSFSFS